MNNLQSFNNITDQEGIQSLTLDSQGTAASNNAVTTNTATTTTPATTTTNNNNNNVNTINNNIGLNNPIIQSLLNGQINNSNNNTQPTWNDAQFLSIFLNQQPQQANDLLNLMLQQNKQILDSMISSFESILPVIEDSAATDPMSSQSMHDKKSSIRSIKYSGTFDVYYNEERKLKFKRREYPGVNIYFLFCFLYK